jgi:hypothetical protein
MYILIDLYLYGSGTSSDCAHEYAEFVRDQLDISGSEVKILGTSVHLATLISEMIDDHDLVVIPLDSNGDLILVDKD